jgi:hypothetical protein
MASQKIIELYAEETRKLKTELLKNVGLRCIILQSPIACLAGKEATIKDVHGELPDGFRYEIELDEPLFSFTKKLNYFPPTFLVEVLKPL